MADKKVTVLARCQAKPGKEQEVLDALMVLIGPTRAEPGCINYDLHQSSDDKSLFMLYENWVSKKDLDEHLKMPYIQDFIKKMPGFLAGPLEILLWDMVSEAKK